MMNDATEVEVNLMTSRKMKQKVESDRKRVKDEAQPSSIHSSDVKFYNMMKTMEKNMERLVVGHRLAVTQQ